MIPWRAVKVWADYYRLSQQEMALLDYCIIAMDSIYISKIAEKLKASAS